MDRRTLLKTFAGALAPALTPGAASAASPPQAPRGLAPVVVSFDAPPPDHSRGLYFGPDPDLRFSVAGIGAAARLLPQPAALASALSMRLARDQRPPDMVILLADPSLATRTDAAALLRAARHARQQGAGFIVALLVHPAAAPAHAGIGLPALAEQCDCLIELPRTPEAPMQCVESLIRPLAGDATFLMCLENVRNALQGPGLIRFGCASAIGPVETRGHRATLAALRQARHGATDDYRGDAFVFVKGNPRTLKIVDAGNAIRALRSHGAGDDAFLETGDSYDESLREGEVSVGIFALPAAG